MLLWKKKSETGGHMRIIATAIAVLVLLSGCGMKTIQQPAPVETEIVRKADWEVEFRDIFFLDAKHGWVIGEKGTILYTEDGGKNWDTQKSGTEARLNKMQFLLFFLTAWWIEMQFKFNWEKSY